MIMFRVVTYVKSGKIRQGRRAYMKTHLSGVKFERIAVDIAGPFPKSLNGFVYILVIADYFTKFTEKFPIRDIEAKTVADTMFRG